MLRIPPIAWKERAFRWNAHRRPAGGHETLDGARRKKAPPSCTRIAPQGIPSARTGRDRQSSVCGNQFANMEETQFICAHRHHSTGAAITQRATGLLFQRGSSSGRDGIGEPSHESKFSVASFQDIASVALLASRPVMRPTDEKVMGDSDMITDGVRVNLADTMKRPTSALGRNGTGLVLPNVEPGATAESRVWCEAPVTSRLAPR